MNQAVNQTIEDYVNNNIDGEFAFQVILTVAPPNFFSHSNQYNQPNENIFIDFLVEKEVQHNCDGSLLENALDSELIDPNVPYWIDVNGNTQYRSYYLHKYIQQRPDIILKVLESPRPLFKKTLRVKDENHNNLINLVAKANWTSDVSKIVKILMSSGVNLFNVNNNDEMALMSLIEQCKNKTSIRSKIELINFIIDKRIMNVILNTRFNKIYYNLQDICGITYENLKDKLKSLPPRIKRTNDYKRCKSILDSIEREFVLTKYYTMHRSASRVKDLMDPQVLTKYENKSVKNLLSRDMTVINRTLRNALSRIPSGENNLFKNYYTNTRKIPEQLVQLTLRKEQKMSPVKQKSVKLMEDIGSLKRVRQQLKPELFQQLTSYLGGDGSQLTEYIRQAKRTRR